MATCQASGFVCSPQAGEAISFSTALDAGPAESLLGLMVSLLPIRPAAWLSGFSRMSEVAEIRPGKAKTAGRPLIVQELAARFDTEHIAVHLKESTAQEYRRNLRRFILPALGRHRVMEVTRADVAKFHHDLRHIPYQANRNLEIISKMFNLAEMWGLRPDGSNPRRHLRKYPEQKRERFLSPSELRRLAEILDAIEE